MSAPPTSTMPKCFALITAATLLALAVATPPPAPPRAQIAWYADTACRGGGGGSEQSVEANICNDGPASSFWLACLPATSAAGYDGSIKFCADAGCGGLCGEETRFANGECLPSSGGSQSVAYTCLGGNHTSGGGGGGKSSLSSAAAARPLDSALALAMLTAAAAAAAAVQFAT